jgi:hypothetical protein
MPAVVFRIGDIFETGVDLTVLPCSAKGHISRTANAHVELYGLSLPSEMNLGEVDIRDFPLEVKRFPGQGRHYRYYAWAASVIGFESTPEIIRMIGENLGRCANENTRLQIIESPLLGAGAGNLDSLVAGPALRDGFLSTCTTDAVLIIYGQTATIIQHLRGIAAAKTEIAYRAPSDKSIQEQTIEPTPDDRRARAKNSVFISYSHKDRRHLDRLVAYLKPVERFGKFTAWSDREIGPGSDWGAEISAALEASRVAVLLVSADFLASRFIWERELAPLLKKAEQGGVRILWVPLRACAYERTTLKNYQAVHPPDRPLSDMTTGRDKAWVDICEKILSTVEEST